MIVECEVCGGKLFTPVLTLNLVNLPAEMKAEHATLQDHVVNEGKGYVCVNCKTQVQFVNVGGTMMAVTAEVPKEG